MTSRPPPGNMGRWLRAKNTHTENVPPYGAVLVTDAQAVGNRLVLSVTRPSDDQDAMTGQVLIASGQGIKAGKLGHVTAQPCVMAAYDNSDTPAHGELWGPQADSFLLKQGNDGFMVLGSPLESPDRIIVQPGFHRPLMIRFELDADLATTDATATVAVLTSYAGLTSGVTSPTTINNLALASGYAHDGATDDVGIARYDWETGDYTIIRMEC